MCTDDARPIGRVPSNTELCLVAHVSEPRLRQASTDEFDLPPIRVFRAWALSQTHRRLVHPHGSAETVTAFATNLGFDHLGRFAGHDKKVFGHSPSATLNS